MTLLIYTPIFFQIVTEVAHGKMKKTAARYKWESDWQESEYKDIKGSQKLRALVPNCVWMGIGRALRRGRKRLLSFKFLWGHKVFFNLLYWNIVDLQCFVNFYCTAKWFSCVCVCIHMCVCILFHIFHYGLSEGGEYAFLCSTVGACCYPSYIWKGSWWTYLQSRSRDADTESGLGDTVWGRGRGELRVWHWRVYTCLVAQSCPTLCDPVDCSPPGSSVHGVSQARALEWGAISFSHVYNTMCKIVGSCSITQGAQPTALWWPRGVGSVREGQRKGTHGYIRLMDVVVWQKPAQHCKSIVLQLKILKRQ